MCNAKFRPNLMDVGLARVTQLAVMVCLVIGAEVNG